MPLQGTTELKQKATETFKKAVKAAKNLLLKTIKEKIKEFFDNLISSGTQKIKPILDGIKKVKTTIKTVTSTYEKTVAAAKTVKAAVIGGPAAIIEAIKQAAQQYKNKILNTSGVDVDAGLTQKEEILQNVDPESEPDDSLTGLSLKFEGAKVKLDSINELIDVVKKINSKLNNEDAAVTRAWVHRIERTHPLVDEGIKKLTYFKEVSNETGSTYLMHTSDTQTLSLGDWATEIPNPFRRTLEYKMDDSYNTINKKYYELNKRMSRNISTEFFYKVEEDALKSQGNNWLNKKLLSNDYHIAGDYTFAENHVGLLEQILMTALIAFVGGSGKLINWVVPVNSYSKAISNSVVISVEGNDVKVNLKGDKEGVIAKVINETPITPEG